MKKILTITILSICCASLCEAQIKADVKRQEQQKVEQQKRQEQQKVEQQKQHEQAIKAEAEKKKQAQKLEAQEQQAEIERIERQRREEQEHLIQLRKMKKAGMELYATFDRPTLFGDKIQDLTKTKNAKYDRISDTPDGKGSALYLHKDNRAGHNYIGWTGFERYTHCTVSFWIKDFGTELIFDTSTSKYLSGSNHPDNAPGIVPYFYCTSDGYFKLVDRENPNNTKLGDVLPLKDGKWHMITVVMQNLTSERVGMTGRQGSKTDVSSTPVICKLYVDGKIVTTHVSRTWGFSNLDTFGFGGVCSSSSFKIDNASDMKLDNIRIYSRALSAGEVETIYREEQNPEILAEEGREKQEEKINQVAEEITDNNGNGGSNNVEVSSTDVGVEINGITWATRNVDKAGTFAVSPESLGMFFQWNKTIGWSSTSQPPYTLGGRDWDGTHETGATWQSENNPCPRGWRVPTQEELLTLFDRNDVHQGWQIVNGVAGAFFEDIATQRRLFLPAAGLVPGESFPDKQRNWRLYSHVNTGCNYWLSELDRYTPWGPTHACSSAKALRTFMRGGQPQLGDSSATCNSGLSVRCVAE